MSKKLVLASAICIILGTSSMITGPVVNNVINDVIEDSVDEVLLIAREIATPVIEDVINMTNFVETIGVMYDPSPFSALVAGTNSSLEILVSLLNWIDSPLVLSWFFDVQYTGTAFPSSFSNAIGGISVNSYSLLGVSEWAKEDLNFGDAKYTLIEGTDELPGICSVVYDEMGAYSPEGWWALLTLYDEAKGNPQKEQALVNGYGTTWYKLDKLVSYYREYYMLEVIPQNLNHPFLGLFFPGAAGMNSTEMANYFFLNQWANCIIFPDGIDIAQFNIVPGFPSGIKGLEAGYPTPTNMPDSAMRELWNINNPYSLVNNEGNKMWRSAVNNYEVRSFLQDKFALSHHAMDCLMNWRVRLTSSIIPVAGGALLGWDIDLKTWTNSFTGGLMLLGGSLITLGSSIIYGNFRKKINTKNNLKTFPPKKQVAQQLIKHLQDDVTNNT